MLHCWANSWYFSTHCHIYSLWRSPSHLGLTSKQSYANPTTKKNTNNSHAHNSELPCEGWLKYTDLTWGEEKKKGGGEGEGGQFLTPLQLFLKVNNFYLSDCHIKALQLVDKSLIIFKIFCPFKGSNRSQKSEDSFFLFIHTDLHNSVTKWEFPYTPDLYLNTFITGSHFITHMLQSSSHLLISHTHTHTHMLIDKLQYTFDIKLTAIVFVVVLSALPTSHFYHPPGRLQKKWEKNEGTTLLVSP